MHFLIIAQYFPPDIGGASTRAYNIAKALILKNHSVTVITAFPHYPYGNIPKQYSKKFISKEKIEEINIIRTWVPKLPHNTTFNRILLHSSFVISSTFALRHVKKFELIFAMNPNFFSFYAANFYRILFRKNIIRNVDDLWPEVFYDLGIVRSTLSKKILDFFSKISYSIPKFIIPISDGYTDILISKYKISKNKIEVIEHGVDTTKFVKSNHENKIKRVVYSGAITVGYDFESIIKCAKFLENESVKFIIRGRGDYVPTLQKLIEKNQVNNVDLETTYLSQDKLIGFLQSSDIFLLPMSPLKTIDAGVPTKIYEFFALSKPVVCISEGGLKKLLEKTNSGIVVPHNNFKLLADSIMKLISNPDLCKELGNNGYQYVQNFVTLEKIGTRLEKIIYKVKNS